MDQLQEATAAAEKCVGLVDEILKISRFEGTDDTFAPIVAQAVRQLPSASMAAAEAASPHLPAFRTAIAAPRPTVMGRTARSFHELAPLIAAGLLLDIKIAALATAAQQGRISPIELGKVILEEFPAILFDEIILTWPEVKLSLRTELALAFDEEWLIAMIGTEYDHAMRNALQPPVVQYLPATTTYFSVPLAADPENARERANNPKLFPGGEPSDPDLVALIVRLDATMGNAGTEADHAREFAADRRITGTVRDGRLGSLLAQRRKLIAAGKVAN